MSLWLQPVYARGYLNSGWKLSAPPISMKRISAASPFSAASAILDSGAATVAAAAQLGATQGILLEHTTSSEVLANQSQREMHDSVGYAGIVFT